MALHNYHDSNKTFVSLQQGTQIGDALTLSNGGCQSGNVSLLPYLENAPLYDLIKGGSATIAPWGNIPWAGSFLPYNEEPGASFHCPSDPDKGMGWDRAWAPANNYAFCWGDTVQLQSSDPRGVFGAYSFQKIGNIKDGTSNTLAMSERAVSANPAKSTIHGNEVILWAWNSLGANPAAACLIYKGPGTSIVGATPTGFVGGVWCWGVSIVTGCNTILPPNSVACNDWQDWSSEAICPPDSYHPGGVNALLADGSCRFISDTIDTGDLTQPSPNYQPAPYDGQSPYGVWGALGSRIGGETLSGF